VSICYFHPFFYHALINYPSVVCTGNSLFPGNICLSDFTSLLTLKLRTSVPGLGYSLFQDFPCDLLPLLSTQASLCTNNDRKHLLRLLLHERTRCGRPITPRRDHRTTGHRRCVSQRVVPSSEDRNTGLLAVAGHPSVGPIARSRASVVPSDFYLAGNSVRDIVGTFC